MKINNTLNPLIINDPRHDGSDHYTGGTFATKEEYLAFIKEWKEVYQTLSKEIRIDKYNFRKSVSARARSTEFTYLENTNIAPTLKHLYPELWRPEASDIARRLLQIHQAVKQSHKLNKPTEIKN